jgi:hypothetical protein
MSRVESKLGIIQGGVYRHYKKGTEYVVLGFLVSSTNGTHNGEVLVRYRRLGGTCEFARLETEFVEGVDDITKRFTYLRMGSQLT